MKVILLSELRGKGGEGDVVDVAQGYAENYLFPNRIAIQATPGNIKQLEERRHNIEKREEKRIADAEAAKATLDGQTVKVAARVGDEGQLFGSVTTTMISDAISEQLGVEVDRRRIDRSANIKTAGTHEVSVNLYREISANLYVVVGDVNVAEGETVPEVEEGVEGAVTAEEIDALDEAAAAEAAEVQEEEAQSDEPVETATEEAAEDTSEPAEEATEESVSSEEDSE